MSESDLLAELQWRGMLYQSTEGAAGALSRGPVTGYAGFDPTAPSLHVGHLIPIMGLVQLQKHGHRPIALLGGGTGLIGDPSGRSTERVLQSREQVTQNMQGIRTQLGRFLDLSHDGAALVRDNAEWLMSLGALEFMRDVGKHFTINYMQAKDSVKSRMDAGISFTEFSYMLLQAYDFLELFRREGTTFQIGGSDQWGNMTAGVELIRRSEGAEAHAITVPLLTTSSGRKFGKTEAGAVWLDAERTSPYQFFQFWINTEDNDAGRYLRLFTLLPRDEIEALDRSTAEHPERREAQAALARDVTMRVHGADAARIAQQVSGVLFARGDVTQLDEDALIALAREVPGATIESGEQPALLDLFLKSGLVKSRGEARRLVDQGGAYVNGKRATATDSLANITPLAGAYLLLRKGARDYAVVKLAQ